jgi:ribonuclease D
MHAKPTFIENDGQLDGACERWMVLDAVGLDTEFERTRTYYSRPALVQIFDGERVALIDPLRIDDFGPLADLLQRTDVMKVMHAAEGDIEVLEQLTGVVPKPVFDTQVAAAFTGHGYSLGYRKLTQMLLGVELSKDETRSDWLKRPLSDAQIAYAALDVVHLLPMYELLRRALDDLGRSAWLREEICRAQRRREADRDPRRAYQRIRAARRLDVDGLCALRELAAWREREARSRDLPRQMILKDSDLLSIASALPSDAGELAELTELPESALSRYSSALVDVLASARTAAAESPPAPEPAFERRYIPRLKALKEALLERAHALGMPAPMLAQSRTLESLIQAAAAGDAELPEELRGWRQSVIGEPLRAALEAMDNDTRG